MRMQNTVVMWSEELDSDSDDEINLEIEGETVSEESNNEMLESENETSIVACWWVGRLDNGQQETQGIHIY
jgi:hypothetical protein